MNSILGEEASQGPNPPEHQRDQEEMRSETRAWSLKPRNTKYDKKQQRVSGEDWVGRLQSKEKG